MITMFLSFLVERDEQGSSTRWTVTSTAVWRSLPRIGADAGPFVQAVQQTTSAAGMRWADWFSIRRTCGPRRHRDGPPLEEAHVQPREQLAGALEKGLEKTLTAHSERLAALESKAVEQRRPG